MELTEIFNMLNGIPQFEGKVAYRFFPMGFAPDLPFICYLETSTNNAFADNKVYSVIRGIDIELYTETKDSASERLVEDVLNKRSIPWNKNEEYIDTERCYQITYSVEV